jgi:hypothetical protein
LPWLTCNFAVLERLSRSYYMGEQFDFTHTLLGTFADEFVVSLVVGNTYEVGQIVSTSSGVASHSPSVTAAGFTATFSLTPMGAGYGYTTASGHRYEAAPSNAAPTARAGDNQTVRPGATVQLDGSGSFDDNTPTNALRYAWTLASVPAGSAATLTAANTVTPTFTPDVPGTYIVELVVTDESDLSSAPAQVTIGEDPPPTADAGPDQLVLVGSIVTLTGSGADTNNDALTYSWALTGIPAGSAARVDNPALTETTFIADRPGIYTAQLTVSDLLGPGQPDTVQITATTAASWAERLIHDASAAIRGLPANAITNGGNQNALTHLLSNGVVALQGGELAEARHKLEQALGRTDGCALRGTPDGNGPGRDWIITCQAQSLIYSSLLEALTVLAP